MIENISYISSLFEKLKYEVDYNSVTLMQSADVFVSSANDFDSTIWEKYSQIKKPQILCSAILVPVLAKNNIRILLYLEKTNPKSDEAMKVLTWLLNNIDDLESELKTQKKEINEQETNSEKKILAMPCSPGIAMGKVVLVNELSQLMLSDCKISDINNEITRLSDAVKKICEEMQEIGGVVSKIIEHSATDLFDAYCSILDRHGIVKDASEFIIKNHCNAEYAVQEVIQSYVTRFQSLSDPYLKARAIDLKDIGNKILLELNPINAPKESYPSRTILVANELSPITFSKVPKENLVGLVCKRGSKYSHVSILARALGIPYIINALELEVSKISGATIIVDGYTGSIHVNPSESSRRSLIDSLAYEDLMEKTFQDVREKSSETGDGSKVELNVNVGLGSDIQGALRTSADGVGLFRTEIPFMLQDYLPTFDLQVAMYSQMLKTFHPRKVVIRTLDSGGDKRLPYIRRKEDNPYLGSRGIRFSREFPSVFRMQMEAIICANKNLNNAKILLPMISNIDEVFYAIEILHDVANEHGVKDKPEIGVMIEVPGIIAELDAMSDYVDFFSVGTNDLTQYLLAVDRNNSKVASLYDSWHPAVLSALYEVLMLCKSNSKPVSVCGEIAGDPMGALLLVAMGYRSLSMNHKSLLKVKWLIRQFNNADLSGIWWEVFETLAHGNAYRIVKKRLQERDLGRFVSKK